MENVELTKDSKKLIAVLYRNYLEKRKSGISKSEARCCGSSHDIHENLMPDWTFEDVEETCRELSRANFISCIWYDNTAHLVTLSDSCIIYMESRFKNGLTEIVEYITKFIP